MAFGFIAPNRTYGNLDDAVTVSSNDVVVYGIVLANEASAAVDVDITDAASAVFMEITVPADSTVVMNIPFLSEGGLRLVQGDSTTKFTVFHSNVSGAA